MRARIVRILVAVVMALALSAVAGSARAQQPILVPPRLVHDAGVRYPAEVLAAHDFTTVTVNLAIEVDAAGRVTHADVEGPQTGHGFDEEALRAVHLATFDPATRNGVAVPSKIHFRYTFTPPPARAEGVVLTHEGRPVRGARVALRFADGSSRETTSAADGGWSLDDLPRGGVRIDVSAPRRAPFTSTETLTPGEVTRVVVHLATPAEPAPTTPPPSAEPIEEVHVKGAPATREVTRRSLSEEELAHMPGTRGDALAALQALPGVGHSPEFSGQIIVRGSAPEDTNVYVDGTVIPLVYHFGGLSSVIPTELLERLDLFPGNYSAQYGRGMGGVVEIGVRDPQKDGRFHGLAELDAIDARAVAEGPIGAGWYFLAAARRSLLDLWLAPISSASSGVSASPTYYDYQLEIQNSFDSHQSLRLMFFGSDDQLNLFNDNAANVALSGDISSHRDFWRFQARYENRFSSSSRLRAVLAGGEDLVDSSAGTNHSRVTNVPITGRLEWSQARRRLRRPGVPVQGRRPRRARHAVRPMTTRRN